MSCAIALIGRRRMVGQHDPRSPDPDPRGMSPDMRSQQFGGAARQAGHVVVLGHPVTPVTRRLSSLRDPHGTGYRRTGVFAVLNPDEIQHGQRKRLCDNVHDQSKVPASRRIPAAAASPAGQAAAWPAQAIGGTSPRQRRSLRRHSARQTFSADRAIFKLAFSLIPDRRGVQHGEIMFQRTP